MSTRLGIIGTGRIANRFVTDAWQGMDIKLNAVYNPNLISAEDFCRRHHLPLGTDSFPNFMEQIDAAYVASPTPSHGEYIRMLLEGGKHVLCEKPLVLQEHEARELFELARIKGLVLMEAIKTAYCPGFMALLEVIRTERIGQIRDVEACFTKLTDPQLRELTDRKNGGSMTELGSYGCYAVLKILGCECSSKSFSVQRNSEGLDIFTKTFFEYQHDGRTGLVKSGLGVKSEGELIISGTQGYILVQAPWWLTRHFEVRYEDPHICDSYDYPFEGNGLQYELQYFLHRVEDKTAEGPVTERESIELAGIMERFLADEARYRN